LPVDDDDIPIAQHGFPGWLAAQDSLTAEAGEGDVHAAAAYIPQCPADGPGPRRNHDRFQLLAILMGLIERACVTAAHDVSEHRIPVVADVAESAHHARHR